MKRFYKIIFAGIFVFISWNVSAQVTLKAIITPDSIGVDETAQLSFEVENARQLSGLQAPSLDSFIIVSGPNQQSNMTMINGDVKQSITISYLIKSKNAGTFIIGEASANVNGKLMHSNKLTLKVSGISSQKNKKQDKDNAPHYPNQNFTFVIVSCFSIYA